MASDCKSEASLNLGVMQTIVNEFFEERKKQLIVQMRRICALLNANAVQHQLAEPHSSTSNRCPHSVVDGGGTGGQQIGTSLGMQQYSAVTKEDHSVPRQVPKFSFITERDGDLFTADDSFSLAHCVAADLQMGRGIQSKFRDKFKRVDDLLDQRKEVGQVAILSDKSRFIYYLITKQRSQGKPTMGSLESSLWEMAEHCHANGVKRLAMPRIGCGLDRLIWSQVKALIGRVFDGSGVEITVFNYPQIWERKRMQLKLDRKATGKVKGSGNKK